MTILRTEPLKYSDCDGKTSQNRCKQINNHETVSGEMQRSAWSGHVWRQTAETTYKKLYYTCIIIYLYNNKILLPPCYKWIVYMF